MAKRVGYFSRKASSALRSFFGTINRWERGACKPSKLALDKIEAIISNQIRGRMNKVEDHMKKYEEERQLQLTLQGNFMKKI